MTDESSGFGPEITAREHASGQKVFGRYTLRKVLGRGGMGVVWLARDEELERDVALKFLPDLVALDKTLLDDLKRETRRSLELTHKNIVRIYDFVQSPESACISMEYIDGDTLSNLRADKEQKVFQPDEIAGWTSQLCDALDYAHNHARIIHRDLKPANLMVNQRGDLKVSDFGIARSLGDSMSKLTMVSGTSGTLVYMSPQQLNGERGTHLDDVYSLGATLYDLLTGKPPFYSGNVDRQIHERTAPSMTERRKEFNVEPALVPALWEAAIAACLAKDPAKRPQSTAEVAERLQLSSPRTQTLSAGRPKFPKRKMLIGAAVALSAVAVAGWYLSVAKPRTKQVASVAASSVGDTTAIPPKSVAVLPFQNLSAEKDDAFFAEGIQDDVLTSLGKIKELTVIARSSVLPYRGEAAAGKLREIGQLLRVAHILQGSVRRVGNRVVVNVQLIDARNDRQIWTERYERTVADALSLQGELAVEIARELRATLTPLEQGVVATKPTENPDAYVLYLRARELEIRFNPTGQDLESASKLYQQAVDLDPKFALARARLSLLSSLFARQENVDQTLGAKALAEAEEALRLQPNLGEARLALGSYYLWIKDDLNRALAELSRAEELSPNSSEVWTTRALIYKRQEKFRERIAALQHAEMLNPRDTNNLGLLGKSYHSVRNWTEGGRVRDRVRAMLPEPKPFPWIPAYSDFRRSGVLDPLKKVIAEAASHIPAEQLSVARFEVAMFERDYPAAERHLRETPAEAFSLSGHPKSMHEALLAVACGADPAATERALVTARQETEKQLADEPGDHSAHGDLALIDAFRGRKEEATREALRGIELANYSTLEKNDASAVLALVYARTGEPDKAIELIEKLLTLPANLSFPFISSMTQADLKWRWVWDPLRSDPRFQKIVEGPEPKTIY